MWTLSSLAALEVVLMTTSGVANDYNAGTEATFCFQHLKQLKGTKLTKSSDILLLLWNSNVDCSKLILTGMATLFWKYVSCVQLYFNVVHYFNNKIHCIAQQSTFYVAIGFATMIMKATANICTKKWRHTMQGIAALRAQTSSAALTQMVAGLFCTQFLTWTHEGRGASQLHAKFSKYHHRNSWYLIVIFTISVLFAIWIYAVYRVGLARAIMASDCVY